MKFVSIDFETANSNRGSICSVGVAVVDNGSIVENLEWMVRPPSDIGWFDDFNINLHGITPDTVKNAPTFREIYDKLIELVGENIVMAHNAAFDTGAFRDACNIEGLSWPNWTYGCSLVMARKHLQLPSYKLPNVCRSLGIDLKNHHNAEDDALACAQVTIEIGFQKHVANVPELAKSLNVKLGKIGEDSFSGCASLGNPRTYQSAKPDKPQPNSEANPEHEFFANQVVFTGQLGMPRSEAWRLVANLGGVVHDAVTKKTRYLVIGDGFKGENPQSFSTGKAKRAVELLAQGQDIEVLDESDFLQLISEESII
jgi:DNA polymerase-3 subunit epsilon